MTFLFGENRHFHVGVDSLNNEITGLEDWVESREKMDNSFDQFAALVEKYVDVPELTPTIVNENSYS